MLTQPMCLESYCHFLSLVFKDYPPAHPGIYTLIYRAISEHLLAFSVRNCRGSTCFCHVFPTNLQNGFLGLTEREGRMYEDVCIVMDNVGYGPRSHANKHSRAGNLRGGYFPVLSRMKADETQ